MLRIYTSTIADNSMKVVLGSDEPVVDANRAVFLNRNGIAPRDTTLVYLTYDGNDYRRYDSVNVEAKGDGITRESTIISDGLVVTEPGHALLLPLADCIGAVMHDTVQNILMVSHLGRHNLEQFGGVKSIEYLAAQHGSRPKDITVWLSPAAGRAYYPLFAFDNRSLHDVATEQLLSAGVPPDTIDSSVIDSAEDTRYFSHSQFLKGKRETDGRFAVVAVLA